MKKRLKQIGENKNNIFKVGALCNDNIKKIKTVNKNSLEKILKTNFFLIKIFLSQFIRIQNLKKGIL